MQNDMQIETVSSKKGYILEEREKKQQVFSNKNISTLSVQFSLSFGRN